MGAAGFLPLAGTRVLDWTEGVAGPHACQMMGDLGADVVKVERPEGDWGRSMGGGGRGTAGAGGGAGGGAHFRALNRNKRALCLDLRRPEAAAVAWRLVDRADVMVTSYRPGVVERLGFGYDVVHERAPALVYARVSAYGQDGPLARRPGSDTILQAVSGLMSQIGDPGQDPHRVGVPVVDFVAARDTVIGVLAALVARGRGGAVPGPVDVSLFASAATLQSQAWQKWFESGTVQRRAGHRHPSLAPAGLYRTSDGRQVAVAVLRDEHFVKLCEAVGAPDLPADPRFTTNARRLEHRDELEAVLVPLFAARSLDEWARVLLHHDVLAGPVMELPDIAADPDLRAALPVVDVPGGRLGPPARAIALPLRFGTGPAAADDGEAATGPGDGAIPPPALGQHTREVLAELGYGGREIDELVRSGVAPAAGDEA